MKKACRKYDRLNSLNVYFYGLQKIYLTKEHSGLTYDFFVS